MQTDPSRDWQALSELYRKKSDEEINELAQEFADLTEVAREVLRGEMKTRGMDDPATPKPPARRGRKEAEKHWDAPGQPAVRDEEEESELPREYTWKTPLCTCATVAQAKQIAEVLRRAKIESWIEGGQNPWDAGSLRVVVAADELDQARELMANPIPQEVVEETSVEAPEYVAPACPACGAEDPVLEGVEPVNQWLCETCGRQWNEGAEGVTTEAEEKRR
jgi:ribosomal protein L37AE/L43A